MRSYVRAIYLLALTLVGCEFSDPIQFKLTLEEARRLADLTTPKGDGGLEGEFRYDLGFFVFQGIYPDRDGSFGWFAVNPWTGDVWDYWFCQGRYSTPALEAEILKLKERFRPYELLRYEELRRLNPGCIAG